MKSLTTAATSESPLTISSDVGFDIFALANQTSSLNVTQAVIGILQKSLEVSALGATALIGASMNLAIMYLYIRHPYTLSSTGLFILNLIVTDLIGCIAGIPIIIYGVLREKWPHSHTLCFIFHAVLSIPYLVSFWAHLGLGMCRFCLLKFNSKLAKFLLQKWCVLSSIVCMWVMSIAILWSLLWVREPAAVVVFQPDFGACGVVHTSAEGYFVLSITLTTSILLPLLLWLILYIIITCEFKRQVNRFPSELAKKKFVSMSKYTTVSFAFFCFFWLPDYLRILVDVLDEWPIWVKRLCFNLYWLNCAINPYLYALRCDPVKYTFSKQFPRLATLCGFNKHNRVAPMVGEGGNQVHPESGFVQHSSMIPRPAVIDIKSGASTSTIRPEASL